MKFLALFSFLLSLAVCHAEIKFPKGSYNADTREQALEQAGKDKKPVAYILTNKDTTCPLAAGATEDYLKAIGRKCVIVHLPSGKLYPKDLEDSIITELKKGRFYPKMVLWDAAEKKVLLTVTYEEHKEAPKETAKKIRKALQPAPRR